MIGRLRMTNIPYDITKYIAKKIWASRYKWRIEEEENSEEYNEENNEENNQENNKETLHASPDSHSTRYVKHGWHPNVNFKYN